ncbi:MAG: AIR synthase related protein [Streptosporangiaceae bacterium]
MTPAAGSAPAGDQVRRGSPQPLPGTVREELVLERIDRARRSRPRVREDRITMSHGAGGKATQTLIEAVFLDAFRNPLLEPLEDAAQLRVGSSRLALTTDSYVVSPLFFPGGDIGDLAVNGTVNDLAVSGAAARSRPRRARAWRRRDAVGGADRARDPAGVRRRRPQRNADRCGGDRHRRRQPPRVLN